MATKQFEKIAIGDIGTQLFWFNKTAGNFEYALPVTAGAEFGGDAESFEAPETDLDYIPKIGGRRSINDIEYTINYTKEKYMRAEEITDPVEVNTYMEVLSDGSAMVFQGTCPMPSITAGDIRQITMTIIPSFITFVPDIYNLTEGTETKNNLQTAWYDDANNVIKINAESIPTARQEYYTSENAEAE